MSARQILRVAFEPDAVVINYLTVPDDLRATGLHATHELVVPMTDREYSDEVDAVLGALDALLVDVLEDMDNLDPYDPAQDQEDDSDDDHED